MLGSQSYETRLIGSVETLAVDRTVVRDTEDLLIFSDQNPKAVNLTIIVLIMLAFVVVSLRSYSPVDLLIR